VPVLIKSTIVDEIAPEPQVHVGTAEAKQGRCLRSGPIVA
jgi:hypothetical protein